VRFAAAPTAAQFGPRIRAWAGRLGLRDAAAVTVLADGADGSWRQGAVQLPGAAGVLDIDHALEHVGAAARAVFGEGAAAGRAWAAGGRDALRAGGGPAVAAPMAAARRRVRAPAKRRPLDELDGNFGRQREHLGDAARLAAGQRIGSGLVEGACKQVIGRRRKQTGARWTIRRVNRMATWCCALHGDIWGAYWGAKLN
jgi:hypothetical protein